MAVIAPQTDVYLLKVPLEMDNINQLTFGNKQSQYNYFTSLPKLEFDNFTYQRKDNIIRIPALIDNIIEYNYVMYRNEAYSDKYFYAYIDKMEYINDQVTSVSIRTDTWQTWQFDLTFKPVFVEREHVNDDTVGIHTLPENLELGDYVKNSNTGSTQVGATDMWYAVGVSEIVGSLNTSPSSNINGLPNGLYYVFTDTPSVLHNIVEIYDNAGKGDAIYSMFVFPKQILYVRQGDSGTWKYSSATWTYSGTGLSSTFSVYVPDSNDLVGTITDVTITPPDKVGMTYTPRNNKLKTWPYCFFNITNNSGVTVSYRYEDFNGSPAFTMEGTFNVGCDTKLFPTNYKNFSSVLNDNTYDYGITGGKYPTISWNSDSYTNWLTQNAVNVGLNAGESIVRSVASAAGGNYAAAGASLLESIGGTVAQFYQASLIPDQAKGNTNVGDINYTKNKNKFTIFELSIKPEYAAVVDNWFDMFGYKVNRVKLPNITGRRNWNYVKTRGCYIEANIPQEDLQEIKNMFDAGVTFWHNPQTFMNYNANNAII